MVKSDRQMQGTLLSYYWLSRQERKRPVPDSFFPDSHLLVDVTQHLSSIDEDSSVFDVIDFERRPGPWSLLLQCRRPLHESTGSFSDS